MSEAMGTIKIAITADASKAEVALRAAAAEVERVLGQPVYRAWVEPVAGSERRETDG